MTEKKTTPVLGMRCAACAANVEKRLKAIEGVDHASVNLAARTVTISYDADQVSLTQMKDALLQTGYEMVTEEGADLELLERQEQAVLKKRVMVSWVLALLTMGFAMGWIEAGSRGGARQMQLLLALAAIVFCGRPFYVNAWRQLCQRSASMDTLVAASTAISFLFSAFNTFWGEAFWGSMGMEWDTWFDAPVMIIAFVLTGRLLEQRARHSAASAIRKLMAMQPKTAKVIDREGQAHDIPIAALERGDRIEVKAGERIPVDGTTVSTLPHAIDESALTGEPHPVFRKQGERVYAGTIVTEGSLQFRAEQVGKQTVLANIIRQVQEAQASKAPLQRVADRVALVFVPTVFALSLLTFAVWWLAGGTAMLPHALLAAVSVLVIACPCAMGLATPTALMVGIGKAAEQNILVKDAAALEHLRQVDTLVTDKTGTLTTLDAQGEEVLKPHVREALDQLKGQGLDLWLVSGDRKDNVERWAKASGIAHLRAEVMPQDKQEIVAELQRQGRHVVMVGDGINDSQALAQADVSIAMSQGTDIAMDVAQVTLIGGDFLRIPSAISLSRKTVSMIRQNLFWAFIYNLVSIPIAAGLPWAFGLHVQVTPAWASALMAFSSVSVVANSLRLKYQKPGSHT